VRFLLPEGPRQLVLCIFEDIRQGSFPVATSNSSTRGRVKLLHPCGGTGGTLVGWSALGNARGGFLQTPAFSFELEQVAVVHKAVE
jgi:hypothetical protein